MHTDRLLDVLAALPGAAPGSVLAAGGRPAIVVRPQLGSPTRLGSPDVLLWNGDGYLPVLIRSHRTTDVGEGAVVSPVSEPLRRETLDRKMRYFNSDALALAHHIRLLQELGLASAELAGGVVGAGSGSGEFVDDEVIVWYRLDEVMPDYDARFADRLAVADAAASGGPALAFPSRIGECRRCPWWARCSAELRETHDVSLITAGSDVPLLHERGIHTVDDLATVSSEALDELPLTGIAPHSARVRARAWLAGIPLVRRDEQKPVPRGDVELDVDMESYMDEGAYLWGTYLTGPGLGRLGLETGYRPFVTWQALPSADEGRAFAEFWAYLDGLRRRCHAAGLTFRAYCYSRMAEERWMRSTPLRYPGVFGMPTPAQVGEFCGSDDWVDIFEQFRDGFVVPGSMKLKELAPLAGFAWRDAEPGGANSMAWYRDAVAGVSSANSHPEPLMATRILEYNEDDVRATLALRIWLNERAATFPTVSQLDSNERAPISPPVNPSRSGHVGPSS